MLLQIAQVEVLLVAPIDGTFIDLPLILPHVNLQMLFEIRRCSKTLFALLAQKWLFLGMHLFMALEI